MNIFVTMLFTINLSVPDSVFLPTNAIEINPPQWKFVFEKGERDYIELGYHTIFRAKIRNLYFSAVEEYDFEPYTALENRYFISTPYFSVSHGITGLYRNRSNFFLIGRDTVDFYFSFGRIIPNITFLPAWCYANRNSLRGKAFKLPTIFSLVYSGTDGVLTYISASRTDILSKGNYNDIFEVGVGIMGERKFVSLGFTSKFIPEFNVKALIGGGGYIDIHYGYNLKTPSIFTYLYPDGMDENRIISVMEKEFSLLFDKKPFVLSLIYAIPDSIFNKSLKFLITFKNEHVNFEGEYFAELENVRNFLTILGDTNKALSKIHLGLNIPIWKVLGYNPFLDVYKVQGKKDRVYNISGRLEFRTGSFLFFWEHHILTRGGINEIVPGSSFSASFYHNRRFKIGTRYSF